MIQITYLPLLAGSAQIEVVDELPPDRAGLLLDGRYRIQGPLGLGAMASVYSGIDERTGLQVAIKILKEEVRDRSTYAERFEREVLITSRLNHSCCIRIQDCGHTVEGLPYQVMELVPGRPLAEVLDAEERLDELRALKIMRQLLSALAHCAQAGIIHRDVKPENVLLYSEPGRGESVKLIDFGIAKLMGEAAKGQEQLTSVGLILGTPHYIAPDWVTCDVVDGRADLYSASVMLYEMLCSAPPFLSEDRRALMRMHLKEAPPSLASRMPGVQFSVGLEAMIMKGLAKDPKDRFADANAYLATLEVVYANHVSVTPAAASESFAVPSRQITPAGFPHNAALPQASFPPASMDSVPSLAHRSNRGLLGLVVVLALAVIAGGVYLATKKDDEKSVVATSAADASVQGSAADAALVAPEITDAGESAGEDAAAPVPDAASTPKTPDAGATETDVRKISSTDTKPALQAWKSSRLKVRGFQTDMDDDLARGQCRAGTVEGIRAFLCLAEIDPVESSKPVQRTFTGESSPRRFRARIQRGALNLRVEDVSAKKRKRSRRKIESVFSKLDK